MAKWRIGRGWSRAEIEENLAELGARPRSFDELSQDEMTPDAGWHRESSEWVVALEEPGPPRKAGPFARLRAALERYDFSDPAIVRAHFDQSAPLRDRRMLLELKVLGLHYLCGAKVGAVRSTTRDGATTFGFRYETLEGHLERGSEWFLLDKDHDSGEIRFRVETGWRPGDFPNWWSRAGFSLLAPYYRELWLGRAAQRLRVLAREPEELARHAPAPSAQTLVTAAALGALSGVRSTAGPALLAGHCGRVGPTPWARRAERIFAAPGAAIWIRAAAIGEMAADKHPRIPARISPPALAVRVLLGALVGAAMAGRWRRSARAPALAGAAAAGVSAAASYSLRNQLHRRYGVSSTLLGLLEDAAVIGLAARLRKRLESSPSRRRGSAARGSSGARPARSDRAGPRASRRAPPRW